MIDDDTGYDPERVWAFVETHGHIREDGRVLRLNKRTVRETHRNMLERWRRVDVGLAPLGRWDEILVEADLALWEYEQWERDTYGNLSYRDPHQDLAAAIENFVLS